MIKYAILLVMLVPALSAQEFELYEEARKQWFASNWTEAAMAYKKLIGEFPQSRRRCKSQNNLAYCYRNMGKFKMAFDVFQDTALNKKCSEDVCVDARSELISLAHKLVPEDHSMKQILLQGLEDENLEIRFLAATKLLMMGDKSGMPVFFHAVDEETDQDLRELAINHIIKHGSDQDREQLQTNLEKYRQSNQGKKSKMIRLIIRNTETNVTETKVNVPIGLAQALLALLDDEQIALIKQKANIDLSNLATFKLEGMQPGTVIFSVVDGQSNKEIKLFLE